MNDISSKRNGSPSIALGILMLVLLGPIAVALIGAIVIGSITSASGLLAAAAVLVALSVIGHFFFGHIATWILPMLVILMGIMGIGGGIYGREPRSCVFGFLLIVVGVCWRIPDTAAHPVARQIIDIRKALLQSSSDRNK